MLVIDFKLSRFTRLLAGSAEMTKSKGDATLTVAATPVNAVATPATAQMAMMATVRLETQA